MTVINADETTNNDFIGFLWSDKLRYRVAMHRESGTFGCTSNPDILEFDNKYETSPATSMPSYLKLIATGKNGRESLLSKVYRFPSEESLIYWMKTGEL